MNKTTNASIFVGSEVIFVEDNEPVFPSIIETTLSSFQFKEVIKLDTVLFKISQKIIEIQPQLQNSIPTTTIIQEYRDFKILIFTYKS